MSIQAVAWALEQDVKPAIAKLLLIAIANYADRSGKCWPSNQTLADDCCYEVRALRKVLASLKEAGLIKIEARWTDGDDQAPPQQLSNIITLLMPIAPRRVQAQGGGDTDPGGEGDGAQRGEGAGPLQTIIRNHQLNQKDSLSGGGNGCARGTTTSDSDLPASEKKLVVGRVSVSLAAIDDIAALAGLSKAHGRRHARAIMAQWEAERFRPDVPLAMLRKALKSIGRGQASEFVTRRV